MIADIPLVRSRAILDHARGQPCTLRVCKDCNGGGETSVACHLSDMHKGMGIKASDYSVAFGCWPCHLFLDQTAKRTVEIENHVLRCMIRGMQETWGILIRDEIITLPQDKPKQKKTKPRKPREQRAKIQSRGFGNQHRPMQRRVKETP